MGIEMHGYVPLMRLNKQALQLSYEFRWHYRLGFVGEHGDYHILVPIDDENSAAADSVTGLPFGGGTFYWSRYFFAWLPETIL